MTPELRKRVEEFIQGVMDPRMSQLYPGREWTDTERFQVEMSLRIGAAFGVQIALEEAAKECDKVANHSGYYCREIPDSAADIASNIRALAEKE